MRFRVSAQQVHAVGAQYEAAEIITGLPPTFQYEFLCLAFKASPRSPTRVHSGKEAQLTASHSPCPRAQDAPDTQIQNPAHQEPLPPSLPELSETSLPDLIRTPLILCTITHAVLDATLGI